MVPLIAIASIIHVYLWRNTDDLELKLLPGIFAVGFVGIIHSVVAGKQQRLVLPILAASVGFDYEKDAKSFLQVLPSRLLPSTRATHAEDRITGIIGDRRVTLAEVRVKTGGRRPRTLFGGFVVRFENHVRLPAFFLTVERQTKGFLGFSGRIDVGDLIRVDTRYGRNGQTYGVWLSDTGVAEENPALHAVLDVLTTLEHEVDPNAHLFSAISDGEVMHIALSHPRDLFHLGGFLADMDRMMIGVNNAFDDLNVPLKVVTKLLDAEMQTERANLDR